MIINLNKEMVNKFREEVKHSNQPCYQLIPSNVNIPKLYQQEDIPTDEMIIHVKLFDTFSGWTWYITEYDPSEDLAYGYVKGFENEWGYISISELREIGAIERDLYFQPTEFKNI